MRTLVTAAAAALALTISMAAPALADHNNNPYNGPNQGQKYDDDDRYRDGDRTRPRYGDRDRFDFNRHERRSDNWERGWRGHDRGYYRHHRALSYRQLVRRLQYQGYYGVRGLRPSRWGFGWRAFAFVGRGRPVMIRINPYTGRVLDVRYLYS